MGRLASKDIYGIWAGMTMSWDENYMFDEKSYITNSENMCREGVHGIYTTGSTGEFYAIDYEEFCRMVDIQVEICSKYNVPLQIGCCSDSTMKTLKLLKYVAGKPYVGAAQINIPYWMELTDGELLKFFKDLYEACPDLPLVHYNIPRSKRYLSGNDYVKILEVAPNLVGVKYTFAGNNFAKLQESMRLTPQLSYFAGENLLVSAMMLGAKGSYSSVVATNPSYMLNMYKLADEHKWDEAIIMQKEVAAFMNDVDDFITARGEGGIDPVGDKGLAVASGCLTGSQRTRAPYIGWSDETVVAVREWLTRNYPHFVNKTIKKR